MIAEIVRYAIIGAFILMVIYGIIDNQWRT